MLFETRGTEFYELAFLLTASTEKAEECLLATFYDCGREDSVFKEWAHSWCRCAIIRTAIRIMKLRDSNSLVPPCLAQEGNTIHRGSAEAEIAGVPTWSCRERFIFVLSFLERYSDQATAVLLRCSPRKVREARKRALCHMADACGSLILTDELDRIVHPNPSHVTGLLKRSPVFLETVAG